MQTASSARPAPIIAGFLLAVFAVGTAESLVAGLLPQLAGGLRVPVPIAGQAVTAYAVGVVVGAPVVTVLTARMTRFRVVLVMLGLFVVGTALVVAAPDYPILLAGRIVAALGQGTLFAVALVVTAGVVTPDHAGRAIAAVVSGLTVAIVLGVPLGTLLGTHLGWRVPFAATGLLAVIATVTLALFLPREPAPTIPVRHELRVLVSPPVLWSIATTVVGFAGVGVVYTYIAPLLERVGGFAPGVVSALLLLYGAGSVVGNIVAGRFADRSAALTVRVVFAALTVLLVVLPFVAPHRPMVAVAVLLLGLLGTATIAPLQRILLGHAAQAPTLSAAVNVGGFNLANAVGAALGGVVVAADGLRWAGFVGAALAFVGLLLSCVAVHEP